MKTASQLGLGLGLGLFWVCMTMPTTGSARSTEQEIAQLDSDQYTCMGAERAGSESGVAAYTGKWYKTWPGQTRPHGYEPGPYADEKPLFTITAGNVAQYADKLSDGQKAMFKKYPDTFRMNVYPSHRDFRPADWICDVVKKNAAEAEIIDDGLGLKGHAGAHPFPFPKSGLEAIWNIIKPSRAWTESVIFDIADVFSSGARAWGRWDFKVLSVGNDPDPKTRGGWDSHAEGYFLIKLLLPARQKGEINVGFQPNSYAGGNSTQAWQFNPGIRRTRKAPEIGNDYPVPPSGMRTSDDDYIFNGSPERYTWKLVGKKEIYIPYHNFKINDPAVSYKTLLTDDTINPDYVRYELHRVWIVEGYLKEGLRHIYKKRRIYADEDTWLAYLGDSYDMRDQLWRVNWINYFYSQESGTHHRGVSLYHDLTSGAYQANYLVNERGEKWWRLNLPMKVQEFSPEAATRQGH